MDASGVTPNETLFLRAYNPAQYYFATSQKLFTTTTPGTYATLYRNDTWGDWLVAIANMATQSQTTSLAIHDPAGLGLDPGARWLLWDVNERSVRRLKAGELSGALADVPISGQSLKLFLLRRAPESGPRAIWGGKRLRETPDAAAGRLRLELDGPATLNDVVAIEPGDKPIGEVRVNSRPAEFFFDADKGIVHGRVTYGVDPTVVEATVAPEGASRLPEQPLPPDDLTLQYLRKR